MSIIKHFEADLSAGMPHSTAALPSIRIAREYVAYVTGIDAENLSLRRADPGIIVFRFKSHTDYEYAKGYAELTRLGAPTVRLRDDGKQWDLGDTRKVVIWSPSPAAFMIALTDDRPYVPAVQTKAKATT